MCFPPQSLEASIQGLRIMWRNLLNERRDAAASLLPLFLPCPHPSCPFSISPRPSLHSCHAASNIHTLSSVCWSTDQTITHSCECVLKLTHTHTLTTHAELTCDFTVDFFFSPILFVFKRRLTRCQSGKVLWHVLDVTWNVCFYVL